MPEEDSAPASLVTPDMEERKGVWGEDRRSFPVSLSDIRKWAIAVYWPEPPPPLFWDEEYAASTRWGGVVAPQDFNPFAWPVGRAAAGAWVPPRRPAGGGRPMGIMNGGQTDTYGVPIRPGDVIVSRSRLRDWQERDTRLGHTLFIYNENEWHNQADELVKRRVSTTIRY